MLKDKTQPHGRLVEHGFLISVEIEERGRFTSETVALKLADALAFCEGIGTVDVEELGAVEVCDAADDEYFRSGTRYPGQ